MLEIRRTREGLMIRETHASAPDSWYWLRPDGSWAFGDHKVGLNANWVSAGSKPASAITEAAEAYLALERLPFLPLDEAEKRWPKLGSRWASFRRGGEQWTVDTLFRVPADYIVQQLPARIVGREHECEARINRSRDLFRSLDRETITPQAAGCIDKVDHAYDEYMRAHAAAFGSGQVMPEAWESRRVLERLLDEVDTTFAVLGICDGLSAEDFARLRNEWVPLQQLKAELEPNSAYALACEDAGNVTRLPATESHQRPATR